MLQALPLWLVVPLQALPAPIATPAPTDVELPGGAVQDVVRARVAIDLSGPDGATLEDLQRLDLDLVQLSLGEGLAVVLATPDDLADLAAAALPFEVVHVDEQAYYAERLAAGPLAAGSPGLGAWLNPPFAAGDIGGYYSFAEIESVLDQIHAAYPSITTPKFSIGQTIQGREIWALKVSDDPELDQPEPEVRFDAMHHSREPQGMQTTLWFLLYCVENYGVDPLATYLVDEREIWFLPVVNPDGYVYNQQIAPGGGGLWRKNRRNNGGGSIGVDLNRNYPYQWGFDNFGSSPSSDSETYRGPSPASEPETQAMIAFMQARSFVAALSTHCFSDVWIQPYGHDLVFPSNQGEYDELNDLCTEVNGYFAGTAIQTLNYSANGGTIDYEADAFGTLAWTPEIGSSSDGFWPPTDRIVPLAEENLLAFQRVALSAGAFVYVDDLDLAAIGDGDGFAEPGETVELVVGVRNAGKSAAGSVTATLVLDTPGASVVAGQVSLGTVPSFGGADNASAPLAFQIDAGADLGQAVGWRVVVTYEGFDQELSGAVNVGEPRRLIADDVELDRGWTAGLPGDTADTGGWERGVPDGTSSNGQPANPGADTTVGGQFAFVTGNGGGSGGNDDVDDGFTTLLSPRFDLSGVDVARLSYQRWFADLSVADDVFLIELSNDDGQSWVTLEAIAGNQNQWTVSQFDLAPLLSLTDRMRVRFVAEDEPNNSVVEAAVDDLALEVYAAGPLIALLGTPTVGGTVSLFANVEQAAQATLYASAGTADLAIPGVSGNLLIDPSSALPLTGFAVAANAPLEQALPIPSSPSLSGVNVYLQALVVTTGGVALTNRLTLSIE